MSHYPMSHSVNTSQYSSESHLTVSHSSSNFDPVSKELLQIFHLTFLVISCGLISLFGVVTNIINIIVFFRQKFKETINISLLSLAVADLSCVLTMLWTSISGSPLVAICILPFNDFDVSYASGAWPHMCFNRVTTCITAFITLERCLCVTMPLKVKSTLTSMTTKIVNISIFIVMLLLFAPFYFVNSLAWLYTQKKNKTLLTLVQSADRVLVETVTFPIHSVFISVVALFAVIVCTLILIVSLNRKASWRHRSVVTLPSKQDTSTTKEKKVVKMVVLISTIFIICYTPATITFLVMVIVPEFSFTGMYGNLFVLLWCLTLVLETVNSSVNIFIYFKMSTKFRTTFVEIFSAHYLNVSRDTI